MTVFFRLNATPDGQPRVTLAQDTGPRFPFPAMGSRALGCETAMSTVTFDDPTGSYSISTDFPAFRGFRIEETACSNPVVFTGNLWDRTNSRGGDDQPSNRTAAARKWEMQVSDFNFQMRRRVIRGTDGNRPAETDIDRLNWLLASAFTFNTEIITADGLFDDTAPVDMDAANYAGKFPVDVITDCQGASGRNAFVYDKQTGGTGSASWIAGFAYFTPTSTTYTSTLSLSNVLSELNDTTVWAPDEAATLKSDPTRVFTGIYLTYDGGSVYRTNDALAAIYGTLDVAIDDPDIKTQAAAILRADRYLADYSFEEDIITTTVVLPAAKVNLILQGQRVACKFTHFPGYESSTYRRVAERNVAQSALEGMYDVTLELRDPRLISGTLASPPSAGTTNGGLPFQPGGGSCSTLTFSVTGTGTVPGTGNPATAAAVGFLPGSFSFSALSGSCSMTWTATVRNTTPAADDSVTITILVPGSGNWNASVINQDGVCDASTGSVVLTRTLNAVNGVYNPTTAESGAVVAVGSKHGGTYEVDFTVTYPVEGSVTAPVTGQPVLGETPTPTADGSTTTFTTAYAFVVGSLKVFVDNVDQTGAVTSQTPTTGSFTLAFAPQTGEQVTVNYQAA